MLVVSFSLVVLFLVVCLPCTLCWHRRARLAQEMAFQESILLTHEEHQRRRAEAEEADRKVMNDLQALPMERWSATEPKGGQQEDCCLCLESFNPDDELRILPCGHFFHKQCVDKWFDSRRFRPRTCPTCRRNPLATEPTRNADAASSTADNSTADGAAVQDLEGGGAAPSSEPPRCLIQNDAQAVARHLAEQGPPPLCTTPPEDPSEVAAQEGEAATITATTIGNSESVNAEPASA